NRSTPKLRVSITCAAARRGSTAESASTIMPVARRLRRSSASTPSTHAAPIPRPPPPAWQPPPETPSWHRSPVPSPLRSIWSPFGMSLQLSSRSGTPSASLSIVSRTVVEVALGAVRFVPPLVKCAVTVLVYVPSTVAPTVTVTRPDAPGASLAIVQVTVPAVLTPPSLALTNLVPAGSGSVIVTLVAAIEPVLVYSIVYVISSSVVNSGLVLVSWIAAPPVVIAAHPDANRLSSSTFTLLGRGPGEALLAR